MDDKHKKIEMPKKQVKNARYHSLGLFKKFLDGLGFGTGFGISFSVIWYISAYLIYPNLIEAQIEEGFKTPSNVSVETNPSDTAISIPQSFQSGKRFHELPLDEQISESTVIAIARYETSQDGRMKAVIKEFLKKKEGVKIYYDVGDEHSSSSFYPEEGTSYGDGVIIFFTGSPATMKMSMTFEGDRIRSLGDIPLNLFKEKCKE